MRALGFGVCLAAACGVAAVTAATFEAGATLRPAAMSTNSDCAPGPDFSAAVCHASQTDPNAPIATAAFSPVPGSTSQAQAGSASRMTLAQASLIVSATPAELRAARAVDIPADMTPNIALAANGLPMAGPSAALARNRTWTERAGAHAVPIVMTAQTLALSAPLRQKIEDMRYVGHRARMFVFAGNGPRVLAYNFTHGEEGMKIAGWSMEHSIRLGEQQVGMAWQSGRVQVAVADIQRKFSQLGVSVKDNLAAISLTFSTSDPNRSQRD